MKLHCTFPRAVVFLLLGTSTVFSAEPNSGDSEEISYLLEELELGNFDSIAVRGFPVKSRIVRENEVENFEEVKFSSTINEPVPPLAELNDAAAARRRAMEYAEKKFVEIQEFDRFENGKYIHDRVHPGFGNRRDLNEVKTETRDDRKGGFADTLDYATLKWIWKDAEEIFNQDNANDAVKLSEIKTNLETLQSQLNTIKEYQGIKRKGGKIDTDQLSYLESSSKENMHAFRNELRLIKKDRARRRRFSG